MAASKLIKILKAALGQGEKGRRSGRAFRNPKTGRLEGISKKDLKTASKLRKGAIAAGVGAGGLAAANLVNKDEKSYKIKSGDTLSEIAKKTGTTLGRLLKANPSIKDPNKIKVGQEIKISEEVKPRKSVYANMSKKQMSEITKKKNPKNTVTFNKTGGSIGCGKAIRGHGKGPYKKKGM